MLANSDPRAHLVPSGEGEPLRRQQQQEQQEQQPQQGKKQQQKITSADDAWVSFTGSFERLADAANVEWSAVSDKIVDFILPDWSKMVPVYFQKLQRELSMAPGSLAEEIWRDAHDPAVNPEVKYAAKVRVSDDLCAEEKVFREQRKRVAAVALARYLNLDEAEVDPNDVPVIAVCGSGGGLRALVAGSGSLLAASEDGLFDCATYTAGVSGSCWLQALLFSSITQQRFDRLIDHLKARLGVHIASPPEAFALLTSAPTNRCLLSGTVEKLEGDPHARFGLVDVYGTLLAARLLVPKGELGVNEGDFKISHQRQYLEGGRHPMPIYTAVRHEIPVLEGGEGSSGKPQQQQQQKRRGQKANGGEEKELSSAQIKQKAAQQAKEAWFQWFEVTPYEFFCEEFAAGIPTWAMGRKFSAGRDRPPEPGGYYLPETRLPLLLGIFGSAFCATLSHYYKEVRPVVKSLSGFAGLDELIWGHNDDLSKVHPIDPAMLPNPVYGMRAEQLPKTVPPGLLEREYIQLMDAGMSNNLPLYPFLRPGRGVEVVIVFDASADIKNDNWLNVADGYARRRGVKGWPIGVGWPKPDETPEAAAAELAQAGRPASVAEADRKLIEAGGGGSSSGNGNNGGNNGKTEADTARKAAKELGYCTVWVGSTREKVMDASEPSSSDSSPSSPSSPSDAPYLPAPIDESTAWKLMDPDAGMTLVYLPFLANPKRVPGVDPVTSEYMSTWNFIYTPDQVDAAVALARANFREGAEQIRATVRAVYERKKKLRLEAALNRRREHLRNIVHTSITNHGDLFS